MIHIAKALLVEEQERLAAVSASAAGPLPSALVEEMESSSSDDEGPRKRARPENPENRVPIPIADMHRARRGTVVNNAGESCFLSRPSRVLHYHSPVLSQPDVAATVVPQGSAVLKLRKPWIDLILDGFKDMEIRGQPTEKSPGTTGASRLLRPDFALPHITPLAS